jgi:tRNA modification GTPase
VLNKIDLGEDPAWRDVDAVRVCCLEPRGLAQLEEAIQERLQAGQTARRDWSLAINTRHQACLLEAARFADAARQALVDGLSPEFVAEELRSAMNAVGDVVGRVDSEDLLGKIFSTFCIGK